MAVNGVEIKVGQVWRTRGGSEVRTFRAVGCSSPWVARSATGDFSYEIFDTGCVLFNSESAGDLMFLVSDPDVGKERRKQQTENPPLRRKDDYPPVPADLPDLAASPADFAASVPGVLAGDTMQAVARSINAMYDAELATTQASRRAAEDAANFVREIERGKGAAQPTPAEPKKVEMTLHIDASMAVGGPTALDRQVGGSHYKGFRIQPVEFIHKNHIPFIEGNAIKYLCRWREKGGVADLEKVKHYVDLLIQMESQA